MGVKWSDKVKNNYPTVKVLYTLKDEITHHLGMATAGYAVSDERPLPNERTPKNLMKYIANFYDIETDDIITLLGED